MNIFGFTITRTSKREEEKREVEIFEKCVDTLDAVTNVAKNIVQSEPNIHTVQSLAESQEHLESLIDIYLRNKYSRPANIFNLTSLIQDMRKIYSGYATAASQRAMIIQEFGKLKEHDNESELNVFGEVFNKHYKKSLEQRFHQINQTVQIAAKEYFISLNAIRHTITYDITRIAIGIDVAKQYKETKGYTIPQKGVDFTVRFKKLSRDEINEQTKPKEDEEDEHAKDGV